jgi:NADH-quinone oxidoreductase subunit E
VATATLERQKPATRSFVRVHEIIQECGASESSLIPILQKVQDEYRYLPEEILACIATELGLSPAHVCGVATFYAQFSLEPKGKHLVRVCDGTACHVRDNRSLIEALKRKLKLPTGTSTTADLRYTLEIVNCIGACALAPAVVIDDDVYGQMTGDKAVKLLTELDRREHEEAVAGGAR